MTEKDSRGQTETTDCQIEGYERPDEGLALW